MGQGFPRSAGSYVFAVSCYISPAGTWSVDLEVKENWGKGVRVPLKSGTAAEYLSKEDHIELLAVVRSHLERGIDHIIAPF